MVAENVVWREAGRANRPDITIPEAELQLDRYALLRFKLEPQAFRMRRGRMTIPFVHSNSPPAHLPFQDIDLDLNLLSNARWDLANFSARCLNAGIRASGTMTNASAFLSRKPGEPGKAPTAFGRGAGIGWRLNSNW